MPKCPTKIFGLDLDEVLGYYTIKYAHIRDCRLGIIQKALMLLILVKICALTIVYQCNHLVDVPVMGSARANAQQPTHDCNPMDPDCTSDFTPLSQLPYCTQFKAPAADAEEDGSRMLQATWDRCACEHNGHHRLPNCTGTNMCQCRGEVRYGHGDTWTSKQVDGSIECSNEGFGDPLHKQPKECQCKQGKTAKVPQATCEYWDAPAMTRGRSPVPGTLFLPTRITSFRQKEGCKPDESNDFKCTTKPWVHADGDFKSTMHVADVERFTMLINQAFSADLPGAGPNVQGRSADFQGFAVGRPDLIDFYTKNANTKGRIARLEKEDAAELKAIVAEHPIPTKADDKGDFKNTYSIAGNGDVFEVSDILRMADIRGADVLDVVRGDGSTMRTEGGVISIDITYTNKAKLDVLGNAEPHYVVSAKYIPMKYYKIDYESMDKAGKERIMHDVHGLLILINVQGAIRVFTMANLLVVLTTAMVSLALANTLTDYIMSYAPCLGVTDHYDILKYQPTMDFSDLRDRIKGLKKKCAAKGKPYDSKKVKASVCSSAINHFATKAQEAQACKGTEEEKQSLIDEAHISHDTMLQIICCFEQRLNRLDGMDAANSDDACGAQVLELKKQRERFDGKATVGEQ